MIIHRMAQASPEWLAIRAGIPTASEMDVLLTAKKLEPAKGQGVDTYLFRKLAERWLGRPMDDKGGSFAMEQGTILEQHAVPWFELEMSVDVKKVGFVTTDDGRIGCSPDGLFDMTNTPAPYDVHGLECKAPLPPQHVKYLMGGVLPADYVGQVQTSMLVTDAPCWHFLSYCRGFPQFRIRVERDETYIAAMREAAAAFNDRLDKLYARMVEINGGEPDRRRDPNMETLDGIPDTAIDDFLSSHTSELLETL